jgi:chaperonin GroES
VLITPHYQMVSVRSRVGGGISHRGAIKLEIETMKFRPLHDRVVIRRLNAEQKTSGGIIIPDTAQEKPMEGEVVAAGPGLRNELGVVAPLDVKAGDRILFGKWSGTEVKIDGDEMVIMKESDILGVIEGAPAQKSSAAKPIPANKNKA